MNMTMKHYELHSHEDYDTGLIPLHDMSVSLTFLQGVIVSDRTTTDEMRECI